MEKAQKNTDAGAALAQIKTGLQSLEKLAGGLVDDKLHGRSVHAGALRARILSALDSVGAHEGWMQTNPGTPEVSSEKA